MVLSSIGAAILGAAVCVMLWLVVTAVVATSIGDSEAAIIAGESTHSSSLQFRDYQRFIAAFTFLGVRSTFVMALAAASFFAGYIATWLAHKNALGISIAASSGVLLETLYFPVVADIVGNFYWISVLLIPFASAVGGRARAKIAANSSSQFHA